MNSKVLVKTAQKPEGPWSDSITLVQATPITNGSSIYAAVPHPYFDESGKTLVVTFTNHPNCIQAVKVVFA
jgi:beta-xylosidase